jgi:ABC-type sugar transport system ATPase subunit
MFLGREPTAPATVPRLLRGLSENEMERRTAEQLDDLGVTTIQDLHDPVGSLSGGQRQAVAVARATLWGGAKVIILDEPTAALGVTQTEQVLELVRLLRERGLGVVIISHNIEVVFEVADRIVVLYVGRRIATFEQAATTPQDVVSAIIGGVEDAAATPYLAAG